MEQPKGNPKKTVFKACLVLLLVFLAVISCFIAPYLNLAFFHTRCAEIKSGDTWRSVENDLGKPDEVFVEKEDGTLLPVNDDTLSAEMNRFVYRYSRATFYLDIVCDVHVKNGVVTGRDLLD